MTLSTFTAKTEINQAISPDGSVQTLIKVAIVKYDGWVLTSKLKYPG